MKWQLNHDTPSHRMLPLSFWHAYQAQWINLQTRSRPVKFQWYLVPKVVRSRWQPTDAYKGNEKQINSKKSLLQNIKTNQRDRINIIPFQLIRKSNLWTFYPRQQINHRATRQKNYSALIKRDWCEFEKTLC